ncbi:hypothetical protein TIFTF001_001557 [Ficus carica]|uniref:Uncharacterized protein n=1 Tax=Ficus carica TaxID=3494 RepID=A0AA88CS11_FICCA|nr:hypothetical protein TIFTF001_001557 [Ficus carica]
MQMMFLKALASNLLDQGCTSVQCIAVHPGVVSTNLVPGVKKKTFWMLDPSEAARSVLHCATSDEVVENMEKGFAYYSSNCKPAKVSPLALKLEVCLAVWKATLSILDLSINYLSHIQVKSN